MISEFRFWQARINYLQELVAWKLVKLDSHRVHILPKQTPSGGLRRRGPRPAPAACSAAVTRRSCPAAALGLGISSHVDCLHAVTAETTSAFGLGWQGDKPKRRTVRLRRGCASRKASLMWIRIFPWATAACGQTAGPLPQRAWASLMTGTPLNLEFQRTTGLCLFTSSTTKQAACPGSVVSRAPLRSSARWI